MGMHRKMQNIKQIKKLLSYDRKTGKFYWKERGISSFDSKFAGKEAGTVHTSGRGRKSIRICIEGKFHYAHRLAWAMVKGEWPEHEIDHKNHDTFDNRWSNLRETTHDMNMKNLPKTTRNTSGAVGVHWCKRTCRWVARIAVNGKRIPLGSHTVKREAIKLRNQGLRDHGFHINHGR